MPPREAILFWSAPALGWEKQSLNAVNADGLTLHSPQRVLSQKKQTHKQTKNSCVSENIRPNLTSQWTKASVLPKSLS